MKLKKIFETCGFHCIKINNLGVRFGEQVVLKDINLHIHCGSLNAIIGKNGAGKSTLVRAILKDVPTEGTIEYRDTKNGKMKVISQQEINQNNHFQWLFLHQMSLVNFI
jgi:zinc transport system ATP-binding protein